MASRINCDPNPQQTLNSIHSITSSLIVTISIVSDTNHRDVQNPRPCIRLDRSTSFPLLGFDQESVIRPIFPLRWYNIILRLSSLSRVSVRLDLQIWPLSPDCPLRLADFRDRASVHGATLLNLYFLFELLSIEASPYLHHGNCTPKTCPNPI